MASPAASVDSLRATLRIAQLNANDDTNPTWDDFEQALTTVDALYRSSASTGDGERLRSLMDEWEATSEVGWSRPLSIEEARCVLSALAEGVAAMTTAEWERMRKVNRG
jgi:hypothetical protein